MKNEFFGFNKFVFVYKMNRLLVHRALINGTLNRDLDIVQQVLIAQHRYPEYNRIVQQQEIKSLTKTFHALLKAKATQESVQKVSNDDRGSSEDGSPSPTDNASRRISIRNILKEKIAGSGKRNNNRRKKEGYIQSRLGKHETKGW